ncbi:hypothetical protein [Alteromonas halophila]|uniref:Type IV pilus biogenesis protein PilP n=1 Tax=Alteromonas halophila TaxID=516698 RepID=A0A918MWM2_9ALTE|nr:hypothetical protein [Alteromonas halophila]GGW79254.1 hypothetical protein GCM10007391_09980 [Alteromonas halophila]
MKYNALLLLSFIGLGAPTTVAAETIENALAKCSEQKNSLQRLVCYDRVVKDLNQYSGLDGSVTRHQPVPKARPENPLPLANDSNSQRQQQRKPETRFGLEHTEDNTTESDTMSAMIAEAEKSLRGQYVITLDNGTVWRQTDQEYFSLKAGQSVTIERGILGAFYLSRSGANKQIKVKRVE